MSHGHAWVQLYLTAGT